MRACVGPSLVQMLPAAGFSAFAEFASKRVTYTRDSGAAEGPGKPPRVRVDIDEVVFSDESATGSTPGSELGPTGRSAAGSDATGTEKNPFRVVEIEVLVRRPSEGSGGERSVRELPERERLSPNKNPDPSGQEALQGARNLIRSTASELGLDASQATNVGKLDRFLQIRRPDIQAILRAASTTSS
eukprot:GHVU01088132.1.p2 GENE.GHVU01088132.1~~GHVU01088132.1.p2  ORF type:complete len:186 (-),score=32.65 GHVU01088132.1:360-917(-)